MQFSVIIPTYNEAENIGQLISRLKTAENASDVEILVVDADSKDGTPEIALKEGARLIQAKSKGRAAQMNEGAQHAKGKVLYFVHGDTLPPITYQSDIRHALGLGYQMGCYRFRFISEKPALRFNSYLTRFNLMFCRGGDQSLFISSDEFNKLGCFREDHVIMEDFEFLIRSKRRGVPFKIIQKDILVSARKYEENSYLRVLFANTIVFCMFRLGFGQQRMINTYRKLLQLP